MIDSYNIEIKGLNNLNDFVKMWSPIYSYNLEYKYDNYISSVLDDKKSFIELFKWKNGTGNNISKKKEIGVLRYWDKVEILRKLKLNFDWELFENEFEPHKESTIWRLFLLHLMNPQEFPIFDQHVYRSYRFFTSGVVEEIPSYSKTIYHIYKDEYQPFFNNLKKHHNGSPKNIDESFFSFGRMLKGLKGCPIQIKKG